MKLFDLFLRTTNDMLKVTRRWTEEEIEFHSVMCSIFFFFSSSFTYFSPSMSCRRKMRKNYFNFKTHLSCSNCVVFFYIDLHFFFFLWIRYETNVFPFSSLYFFDIQFPYGDMLMAFHLEKRWKKLFSSSLYRSKTLHSTKVKFSQMTANDIEKFKQEVKLMILPKRSFGCCSSRGGRVDSYAWHGKISVILSL